MNHYGLIGYPLSHSFSPKYFAEKFIKEDIENSQYEIYPLENIEDFHLLISKKNFKGLNVTIPYKESIIPFLDELDSEAETIGAVNTIKFQDGKLIGYNTDIYGFQVSLENMLQGEKISKVMILGTGGAAKAVAYVCRKMGMEVIFVSRSGGDILYAEVDKCTMKECQLIINSTPLGMHPNVDKCPNIPYEHINSKHFLYDLIYNPDKTLFLTRGMQQKAKVINGMEMLILQAEKSWAIWNQ